jgi:methylaspartate ammonia-lyase
MSYNNDITKNDYKIVESNMSDFYGIKLTTGTWADVIVVYGKVSIKESKETGYATLGFTYQVQDSGDFQKDQLEESADFKNHLGDILKHIIMTKEANSTIEE